MGSTTSIRAGCALAAFAPLLLVSGGCASAPSSSFIAPLERMVVSSEFAERRGMKRRKHLGLDLRAPNGTQVAASAAGRVAFAGTQRGFGRIVIVDHGRGTQTYYAHLSGFAVSRGAPVSRGQTIGFVGQSGNATGPHLHFEVRRDGAPVDPRGYVSF